MIGFGKKSLYRLAMHWGQGKVHLLLAQRKHKSQPHELLAARSVVADLENASSLGEEVSRLLDEFHVTRPETFVALSRSQVEVFHIDLPKATPEELVSLVQLHMMQHEQELAQSAVVDFVQVGSDLGQSRVIVFAAAHSTIDFIKEVVQSFGGQLAGLGVRGLSAFGVLPKGSGSRVLVVPYDAESDIVFAEDDQLITVRSIRLPLRSDPAYSTDLIAALKRSLLIARPHSNEEVKSQIVMAGNADECSELSADLQRDLLLPVSTIDPCVELTSKNKQPVHSSPFAPLQGMFFNSRCDAAVDFLNPRREESRRLPLKKLAIYTTAALLLLGFLGSQLWQTRSLANEEVELLEHQVANLQKMADKLRKSRRIAAAVHGWNADNVVWLDELRELSERFPPASEAYIQRINLSANAAAGNKIILNVRATDSAVVSQMENMLRDPYHSIDSKRVTEASGRGDEFSWNFEAVVQVAKRSRAQYRDYFDASAENDGVGSESSEKRSDLPPMSNKTDGQGG